MRLAALTKLPMWSCVKPATSSLGVLARAMLCTFTATVLRCISFCTSMNCISAHTLQEKSSILLSPNCVLKNSSPTPCCTEPSLPMKHKFGRCVTALQDNVGHNRSLSAQHRHPVEAVLRRFHVICAHSLVHNFLIQGAHILGKCLR